MDDSSKASPASVTAATKSAPEQMQYSIPGILHFIQHEWTRFEMERAHWDVEKAELQVDFLLPDWSSFIIFWI